MMCLGIKGRKAGENRKCRQHRCFAGARSRRGHGVRGVGEGKEVSLGADGGSWVPGPGNASGIRSILSRAPMGRWGNVVNPAVMRWGWCC